MSCNRMYMVIIKLQGREGGPIDNLLVRKVIAMTSLFCTYIIEILSSQSIEQFQFISIIYPNTHYLSKTHMLLQKCLCIIKDVMGVQKDQSLVPHKIVCDVLQVLFDLQDGAPRITLDKICTLFPLHTNIHGLCKQTNHTSRK